MLSPLLVFASEGRLIKRIARPKRELPALPAEVSFPKNEPEKPGADT
jgi:hypothetical protein